MTTFITAKLKKSDDQPNIDKYRESAIIDNLKWTYGHSGINHIALLRILQGT